MKFNRFRCRALVLIVTAACVLVGLHQHMDLKTSSGYSGQTHTGLGDSRRKEAAPSAACESVMDRGAGPLGVLPGVSLPRNTTFFVHKVCKTPTQPAKKLVYIYNPQWWYFPGDKHYEHAFKGCKYDACRATDDRGSVHEADAVLVYVCRLTEASPPPRASQQQVWVAFCSESPIHYSGHHDAPAWRGVFNWTMGYRTDSDVFAPYGALVVRNVPAGRNLTGVAMQKRKAVAWFVSNCGTQSQRMRYVRELKKHIAVDVFGGCGDLKCGDQCMALLNTTYFFYLAFENSLCQDYVTEKLFKTLKTDVIPVVRGGADYGKYLPPGTFVDTAHFASPRQLATHLTALMANVTAYVSMLTLKEPFTVHGLDNNNFRFCELCEQLHTAGQKQHAYTDIMQWTRTGQCRDPRDL